MSARVIRAARAAAGVLLGLAAAGVLLGLAAAAVPQGGLASRPAGDDAMARGRALFVGAEPACAVCHTLADAGATGAVGPSLDELRPDAERVERALRTGFGAMPSYAGSLSPEERRTLAEYVAAASVDAPR